MHNRVRLLVIAACIASVAFFIWKQEAPESLSTGQTVNEENITFDKEKHDRYVETLIKERGLTKADATEEALALQIEQLALQEKINILGIEVSEDEARKEALETRRALETEDDEMTLAMRQEIEKVMKDLGMTEEEYWNDYVVNGYKEMLAIQQLRTFAANEEKHWQDFFRDIVAEFEQKYDKEIALFKQKIGK